ncbi:hypothetical protein FisN_29Lh037 [Fistulifera solaris]|uniref:Vesicle-fusing ATPase n=1 Tax=Fistulifera solaris TaxID=1519565 RepID=A0A1Z5JM23_FISSO|nr:hypothetical protein FisN_29Lh037 [Fistulifera solaris]|eukprot:GAX14831.1 hypothetical protein FisN_29Lh037 [Fistulifera solaris]
MPNIQRPFSSNRRRFVCLMLCTCLSDTVAFLPFVSHPKRVFCTSGNSDNETLPDKNRVYIQGLHDNLTTCLDKWIMTGNPATKQRAYNVLEQIQSQAHDKELVEQAERLLQRAGLPLPEQRRRQQQAQERQEWEKSFQQANERSALSRRIKDSNQPNNALLGQTLSPRLEQSIQDKVTLQKQLTTLPLSTIPTSETHRDEQASIKVSSWVARAWNTELCSATIGGLDDVLSQIKRRIWTPLAAPPALLRELGIHPVRGLLLYGRPGCGKTLVARTLGRILSPLRPISVVSGPEIMDKFVGSSEKNLRELFDNPPPIYDTFRIGETDNGEAISKAALHIIILDEFDAIARARGGNGGKASTQGDAGVARDSVVNQMLAKMDGVDPLVVPTLVIGLTNRRSLIEPALLRPGRFEVQIEVPPPRTTEQRVSILRVHTRHMHQAGRLLVRDAPAVSAASRKRHPLKGEELPSYEELLHKLAERCDGFSGAALTGVTRAAASHALERSVEDFSLNPEGISLMEECVVTSEDFDNAIADLTTTLSNDDWVDDAVADTDADNATASDDDANNEP